MSGKHRQDSGEPAENPRNITNMFKTLGNDTRRRALYYLIEQTNGIVDVEELASHLHSMITDGQSNGHEAMKIQLHHQHLPKMDELDAIEHDEQAAKVRYQEDKVLEDLLAVVRPHDFAV